MNTRTNIVLDDELVALAMAKAGVGTKKAAVEAALRAYVSEPDWALVASMEGSNAVADDYDPRALFDHDAVVPVAAEPQARYPATRRPAARSAGKKTAHR
jgi:Arc/MetJ family transcription regulator